MQIMARQVQWTRAARTDKGVHASVGQCIGFKVCIRFYWFRCVARHFAQNGNVTGCDQRCCCRVHRPNQFTSPSTYASLRSAICIFSSLIFIPFKLPQLSINHYYRHNKKLSPGYVRHPETNFRHPARQGPQTFSNFRNTFYTSVIILICRHDGCVQRRCAACCDRPHRCAVPKWPARQHPRVRRQGRP